MTNDATELRPAPHRPGLPLGRQGAPAGAALPRRQLHDFGTLVEVECRECWHASITFEVWPDREYRGDAIATGPCPDCGHVATRRDEDRAIAQLAREIEDAWVLART
jgi:ribosomal protein S27E